MKTTTIDKRELDELIDPLTVLNNGFELLRYRFETTMDSYALEEFTRIERALTKLNVEIGNIRDKNIQNIHEILD